MYISIDRQKPYLWIFHWTRAHISGVIYLGMYGHRLGDMGESANSPMVNPRIPYGAHYLVQGTHF